MGTPAKNQPTKMTDEERAAIKAELKVEMQEEMKEFRAEFIKQARADLLEEMKGAGPVVGTKLGGGVTGGKGKPNGLVSMTFKKRMKGYAAGNRAGFTPAYAKKLEAAGVAVPTPPEVKEKALKKRADKAAGKSASE